MKFSELNEHQRLIFKDIASNMVRSSIEQRNSLEIFNIKMLLIANGSGLLAMASFIGGIISAHCTTNSNLRWIAASYFLGLISAAFSYQYTKNLAIERVSHTNAIVINIIGNTSKLEDAKDLELPEVIRNRHVLSILLADIFFILGTIWAIITL